MRAGCLYLLTPYLVKMKGHCENTEHKLCVIIRYMHMVIIYWYLGMYVKGKVNYMLKQIYTWVNAVCTGISTAVT